MYHVSALGIPSMYVNQAIDIPACPILNFSQKVIMRLHFQLSASFIVNCVQFSDLPGPVTEVVMAPSSMYTPEKKKSSSVSE